MKFTIIGSTLSGNKGAAAMLESSIQSISKKNPGVEFVLLSIYPNEDKKLNTYDNLTILPASAFTIGFVLNPLALIYKIIPPLRTYILNKSPQLKAIKESEAFLDQGGITFVDGRSLFILYNIATILPALLMNKKVIKCSQAMGPFNSIVNKITAKIILPKVEHIFARGGITYGYLQGLGLSNVSLAADYAFLLEVKSDAKVNAMKLLKKYDYEKNVHNIGISPSEVMRKKLEKNGVSYEEMMAKFIDKIAVVEGRKVYILPHSQREDNNKRHNNDMPVCTSIFDSVKDKKNVVFVQEPMTTQQLRAIIGMMDFNVSARFHAMVASLACGVPVVVTGWNHKYQEVLSMFNMNSSSLKTEEMKVAKLVSIFEKNYKDRSSQKIEIASHIADVKGMAMKNTDIITKISRTIAG